jgi:hypothetical protein
MPEKQKPKKRNKDKQDTTKAILPLNLLSDSVWKLRSVGNSMGGGNRRDCARARPST